MSKLEQIRMKNFLADLDQLMMDNECHDDDTDEDVCELSEDTLYEAMVETKDYRFIGTEKIKSIIHSFYADWSFRSEVLHAYSLF